MENLRTEAEQYYQKEKTTFTSVTQKWEALAKEFPSKLLSLIKSGITPTVSSSSSGNSTSVSLKLALNTDSAKAYMEQVKVKTEDFRSQFNSNIRDMDKKMESYKKQGLDSDVFDKLIKLIRQWVDYTSTMKLQASNQEFVIETVKEHFDIRDKWINFGNIAMRKAEAERYGVSLEDLDKHKRYLEGKQKKASAHTSAAMAQAQKIFESIKDYKDAETLAAEAKEKEKELRVREEEATRKERERREEERRRQEEEERQRREKEKIELEAYQEAFADFKEKEKAVLQKQNEYVKGKMENLKQEIIKAAEKIRADKYTLLENKLEEQKKVQTETENRLGTLGIFRISEKKECKKILQQCTEAISEINKEKDLAEKEYTKAKDEAGETAEKQRVSFEKEAAKDYPVPEAPVKPAVVLKKEEEERKEQEAREQERIRKEQARIREEQERKKAAEKARRAAMPLAELVEEVLRDASQPLTITEIMSRDEILSEQSSMKISAVVRGMGPRVEKIIENRVSKFRLSR